MKNLLKTIIIWLVLASIWVNKYYNFNPFLGLPKVNNFLDLIFSVTDVLVLTLSIWFFALTIGYNYYKPHTRYFVQPTITHLFVLLSLLLSFSINPSFGLLMVIARIFLLINIIPKLLQESSLRFRIMLMIGLLLALFFDHFLISSSLPVVLLLILSMKLGLWQKNIVFSYIVVNFVVAAFQILKGQSLGLVYLGEPVINAQSLNIARETIFGTNILRGYGLTQHPAILGFVAVFGLLFSIKHNNSKIETKESEKNNEVDKKNITSKNLVKVLFQKYIPATLSLLSLSRISLMTFVFGWIVSSKSRLNVNQKILCLGGILGLFVYRFGTSDKYRILDYQIWADVTLAMTFRDIFFGIGYYPEFLYNYYQGLQTWQIQPVHNTVFGLFTQFGVWGFIGLLGWMYFDLMKPYFDNKRKKEQEL